MRLDFAPLVLGLAMAAACGPTTQHSTTWAPTSGDDGAAPTSGDTGVAGRPPETPSTYATGSTAAIDWAHLSGQWHEDGHVARGEPRVFVPISTPVPRSRFVQRLAFGPNNAVSFRSIRPADGHRQHDGVYSRAGETLTLTIDLPDGPSTHTIEVLSLTAELLEIRSNIPG